MIMNRPLCGVSASRCPELLCTFLSYKMALTATDLRCIKLTATDMCAGASQLRWHPIHPPNNNNKEMEDVKCSREKSNFSERPSQSLHFSTFLHRNKSKTSGNGNVHNTTFIASSNALKLAIHRTIMWMTNHFGM